MWFWLGHQGSEYLDLGRFWQLLQAAGLLFWLFLMFRALRPAMKRGDQGELPTLFLCAAIAIPLFYVPALFYGPRTNSAVIDNWRFWIIHLWVEGFFELFATVLVAVMFYQMGLANVKSATRLIYEVQEHDKNSTQNITILNINDQSCAPGPDLDVTPLSCDTNPDPPNGVFAPFAQPC
jgi:nitric oxide reductase large subunit